MTTFLFAWEFGTSYGHITRIEPIARGLVDAGHRVYVAARELPQCYDLLRNTQITLLPAPSDNGPIANPLRAETYAHVLFNCGFADPKAIEARVAAWLSLLNAIKPDFLVADCGPSALLAAHCAGVPAVAIGTGFECPPNVAPLPSLRRKTQNSHSDDSVEQIVLQNMNVVCRQFSSNQLERVSQLYHLSHDPVLLTYRELDCYTRPSGARYWGAVQYANGEVPNWPSDDDPRVFAYLIDHPFSADVANVLAEFNWPTIIVGGGNALSSIKQSPPQNIHFSTARLNAQKLAAECALTICYCGHGTICTTLLAGKPLLLLPTTVEQYLNAVAVSDIGAGNVGEVGNVHSLRANMHQLHVNFAFTQAADEFAHRNARDNNLSTEDRVVAHLHALTAC